MKELLLMKILMINPISKFILKWILKYCKIDKKNRLEIGFELYSNLRVKGCWKCKLVSKIISIFIKFASISIGFNEILFRQELNKNPFHIRYYNNFLKGFLFFGNNDIITFASPYIVYIEITDKCNLKCKHCSKKADEKGNELKFEEVKIIIDKLQDFGVSHIAISGGEPLLHKDIFKILKYTSDKNFFISLLTNGILLKKETVNELKKLGIRVRISLDFPDKERHNAFRGIEKAFELTMKGIKNAVDSDLSVSVCMTATKYNYKDVDKMIELCKEINVNSLLIDSFIPTGRGKEISQDCDLSSKEREVFLKEIYNKMKNSDININAAFTQIYRIALLEDKCKKIVPTYMGNYKPGFFGNMMAQIIAGCPAGRLALCVRSNGNINPCAFLNIKLGNILKDDLEKIWFENDILKNFRKRELLKPYCGICKFRNICGGCRAIAFENKNNYLESDVSCIYNENR